MDELLTEDALASKLGVTRATIRNYRNSGRLGYVKLGGRVLFSQSHIDDFVRLCEVPAKIKPVAVPQVRELKHLRR
jgi:excisionase family DNA binding protein